jgi:hypothetical protein
LAPLLPAPAIGTAASSSSSSLAPAAIAAGAAEFGRSNSYFSSSSSSSSSGSSSSGGGGLKGPTDIAVPPTARRQAVVGGTKLPVPLALVAPPLSGWGDDPTAPTDTKSVRVFSFPASLLVKIDSQLSSGAVAFCAAWVPGIVFV